MKNLIELLDLIELDNIAEKLDEDELTRIGDQIQTDFDAADASMEDWVRLFEEGQEINKPPSQGLSEPFEGASDYKSPIMSSAAYRFGEHATSEILKHEDLVKGKRFGQKAQQPPTQAQPGQQPQAPQQPQQTDSRVLDVTTYMNYQLNYEMPEWRDDHYSLLYRVPNMGHMFKKNYFDPLKGTLASDLIQYPDFRVMQHADSLNDIRNFTHLIYFTQNEVETMKRENIWLDIELEFSAQNMDREDDSHDPDTLFYEQQCYLDLDGDGYEEPYIVTTQANSKKVVRIVARYTADDIHISFQDVTIPLSDVRKEGDKWPTDINKTEIVRINPVSDLSSYRFMPSADGTFLGVGYYQLMSPSVAIINQAVNSLVNAGYLANMQGGFLARGAEFKRGDITFDPGEYVQTDIAPIDMPNAIREHQFKEPSQTLFQLVQYMEGAIKELSSTIDITEMVAANQAASTLLMILEETQTAKTSLLTAHQRAMSKEFQIIFRLNRTYTDNEIYIRVTGNQQADYKADFSDENIILIPTANPEMASASQRIQQGELLVEKYEFLERSGADMRSVMKFYLQAVRIDPEELEKIYPTPNEDSQQAIQKNQQAQQKQAESATKLNDAQTEALVATAEESRSRAKENMDKMPAEIEEIRAKTLKLIEEAESESQKNMLDDYLKFFDVLDRAREQPPQLPIGMPNDPTKNALPAPTRPQNPGINGGGGGLL